MPTGKTLIKEFITVKSTVWVPSLSINDIKPFMSFSFTLIPNDSHTLLNSEIEIEPLLSLSKQLKQSLSS